MLVQLGDSDIFDPSLGFVAFVEGEIEGCVREELALTSSCVFMVLFFFFKQAVVRESAGGY